RALKDQSAGQAQMSRQLAEVERKIAGVVKAIEDGLYTPALKGRMTELEAEKAKLEAASVPPAAPVRLHPNLPEIYRRQVAELECALNDPLVRDEAAEAIGDLIERVVLTPRTDAAGLDAVLHGDLAQILALCAEGKRRGNGKRQQPSRGGEGCQLSVVAGA